LLLGVCVMCVKTTSVGMKFKVLWYENTIKGYEIEVLVRKHSSNMYEKKTQRYENDV
jgi:hypothetical protein